MCKIFQLKPKIQHSDTRWPQHDCPKACVIAQQYSSANFLLLPFYYRKEKLCAVSKDVI
jgi:hypothetical protein